MITQVLVFEMQSGMNELAFLALLGQRRERPEKFWPEQEFTPVQVEHCMGIADVRV